MDDATAPAQAGGDWFGSALGEATGELDAELQTSADKQSEERGVLGTVADWPDAIAAGGWQSIFEVKDTLFGEPAYEEKSLFRRDVEKTVAEGARRSTALGVTSSISQFAYGMIGAGKVAGAAKVLPGAAKLASAGGRAGAIARETAKAAAVGAVAFDPHQERLANIVEEFPALSNPISRYLQAKPTDSAAEGRFKSALESIGLDAALIGAVGAAVKGYSFLKAGKPKDAAKVLDDFPWPPTGGDGRTVDDIAETLDPVPPGARPSPELASDGPTAVAAAEPFAPGQAIPKAADLEDGVVSERPGLPEGGTIDVVKNKTAAGLPPQPKAAVTTPEDWTTADILERAKADADALERYGSREAAIAEGHKFGRPDFPWQKIETGDDVMALIGNAAQAMRGTLDIAKGGAVLKDARLQRLVAQRVTAYGEDPAQVVGMLQAAGREASSMAANMEAADVIATSMAEDAYAVAAKLRMGNLAEWGGDEAAARAEFQKRIGLSMTTFGAARSMLSNSGRTLRRARGDLERLSAKDIAAVTKMEPDRLLDVIQETGGDIRKLREVLNRPSLLARATDGLSFLLVNNLLWGWKTHVVNLASNAYMLGARPVERLIGETLQGRGALASGQSTAYRQAMRELRYTTAGLSDGFSLAARTFAKGDSILLPHEVELHQVASRTGAGATPFKPVTNVGDLLHNALAASLRAIGLPTRALGAVDELVKQVRYRAVVLAEGAAHADELGLVGKEHADHVAAYLKASFDDAGRAINERGAREAKIATFSQELIPGGIGAAAQNAVSQMPALRLILPFVRTPTNVLRYGVKLTPGLNLLQKEFREAVTGKLGEEAKSSAIGQMALGSLFLGTAAALVAEGRFTGTGPADPKRKREMLAAGWQPNSVVFRNEDGTATYLPMNRFDPIGLPMGIIADLMDIMQHPEKSDDGEAGAAAVAIAVAKQITSRSYLTSLQQFVEAVSDPGRYGNTFAGRTAANLIPFSSMLRQTNPDPHMREARGIVDSLLANTPGLSDKLPAKYDAFGDPIDVRKGLHSTVEDDAVDREMVRMGMDADQTLSAPSPSARGSIDLRDMVLEDGRNAYVVYQEYAGHPKSGMSLRKAVGRLIESTAYRRAIDGEPGTRGTKQWMLRGITSKYREAAMARLRRESKTLRDAMRENEMKVRAAHVSEAGDGGGGGTPQAIQALGRSYGVDLSTILSTHN